MNATNSGEDTPAEFNLEVPEDVLALAESFHNEWCNGGLSQLFGNWFPADVALLPEGLRAIGATEAAAIVGSAIAELGPRSQWRDKGHDALINPSSPLRQKLWDMDGDLAKHSDRLQQLIASYELKLSEAADDDAHDSH
ncbi:MAG: DMP19 family protein [Afipia sp.]